jgi:two-component system sensor histidine kinase VicK
MLDPASFFLDQATTSAHIHFIYDVAAQRVTYINEAYELMLQGQRDHVNEELPALLARLHPDDLPLLTRYWQLWTQGRLHDEIEVRLLPASATNGPTQWLCVTPHWQQDASGQASLGGTVRNISRSKLHKNNTDKFTSKKNTVLEILSHDLAGSFVLVQQLIGYVRDAVSNHDNPQVLEMLNMVLDTSQRSVKLIHALVNQEFLESTEIPLKREWVNLSERVMEALEPAQYLKGSETQHLQVELPSEPVYAEVDIDKYLQVLGNLMLNAYKFTPNGGHITIQLEALPNDWVRLTVADDGIGIPAAMLPHLFERFTPARRQGLRGEPTTGLGMLLCKTIVELHGGTIAVESTEGQGSTFTVEIPAFPSTQPEK